MILRISILFLLINTFFFSQKKDNVYLEIPSPITVSKDKNVKVEMYKLTFKECEDKLVTLKLGENNNIIRNISLSISKNPVIFFTYNSYQNPSQKFTNENDANFISSEELKDIKAKNLIEILQQFNNVFIIDKKKRTKKVSYQILGSM